MQLIHCCYSEDSVLYGCNADGIYSTGSKMNFRNKKDISLAKKKKQKQKNWQSIQENMCFDECHVKKGDGVLHNEQAGSGETQELCELVKQSEECIVLSFTNKAVNNVKTSLQVFGYDKTQVNKLCYTFDSYLWIRVLIALKVKISSLRSLIWYLINGLLQFIKLLQCSITRYTRLVIAINVNL